MDTDYVAVMQQIDAAKRKVERAAQIASGGKAAINTHSVEIEQVVMDVRYSAVNALHQLRGTQK